MASFVNIDNIVRNYIRSVSGVSNVDVVANVAGNVLSRPAAHAMLTVSGLTDLAANVASLSSLEALLQDTTSRSNMAIAIGISPSELEGVLTDIVEGIASIYGVVRRSATPATGIVVVGISSFPGNADIPISSGTNFNASIANTARTIRFTSTASVTVEYINRTAFFNPDTNLYEAQIPVISGETGSFTNVSPGAINELLTTILGVQSVFNRQPAFGGTDVESNSEVISRVIRTIRGLGIGTVDGYQAAVRAVPGVVDVSIIGPGHPLMVRDGGLGGAIDIYVITNDVTAAIDTINVV